MPTQLQCAVAILLAGSLMPAARSQTCTGVDPQCDYDADESPCNPGELDNHVIWEAEITHLITHDNILCPGNTCNEFKARVSTRKTLSSLWAYNSDPLPTIVVLPGGISTRFVAEQCEGENEGAKALENALWDMGARILEVKWACQLGPDVQSTYWGTGSCPQTALHEALKTLSTTAIPGQSGEMWWPSDPDDRFAYGVSEGQNQIKFAMDVLDHASGEMNRAILGGGGNLYDLFDLANCEDNNSCVGFDNDACKHVEGINRKFGPTSSPPDTPVELCGGCVAGCLPGIPPPCGQPDLADTCDTGGALRGLVDGHSSRGFIEGWDGADDRATAVLGSTGFDLGLNQKGNLEYLTTRDSDGDPNTDDDDETPAGREEMWNFPDCVCDCAFGGHGAINNIWNYFDGVVTGNPIQDWINFVVTGDLDFDLLDLTAANPAPAEGCLVPNNCSIVEPGVTELELPVCPPAGS